MNIDYLCSDDGKVHAINNSLDSTSLETGILCIVSCQETTIRIANEHHALLVELPKEFLSGSERVKAFNAILNVLSHEQI